MGFIFQLLASLLTEIVFSAIGWLCLYIWYRNRKKVEEVKNKEYAGYYSAAGRIMILNLIAGVGAISLFGILIFSIGFWIYNAITN